MVRVKTNGWLLLCLLLPAFIAKAQSKHPAGDTAAFKKLISTPIAGAPVLGKPILLQNGSQPLTATGVGWASPMILDVNNDGLEDLVVGEFGSGYEMNNPVGNFLKVYENTGTKHAPVYAKAPYFLRYEQNVGYGTPMSIYTWCCMAFTPRLVDMDGDGKLDIVAGQYDPGEIVWYKRLNKSYDLGRKIPQPGMGTRINHSSKHTQSQMDSTDFMYWGYSTTAFIDLDGDGKQDAITGGTMLRYALNTGTQQAPALSIRKSLLDVNGKFLETFDYEHIYDTSMLRKLRENEITGGSMVPYIVDWDNDGVEDLLVTDGYTGPSSFLITFFKGVRKGKQLTFKAGVPLFKTTSNEKQFPGSHPNICVADWNQDGIKDLIIGTCVTTNYGEYDHDLSWKWEARVKTYKKNPAYASKDDLAKLGQRMKFADSSLVAKGISWEEAEKEGKYYTPRQFYKDFYGDYGLEQVAHLGYVYVLLGRLN